MFNPFIALDFEDLSASSKHDLLKIH